MLSEKPVLLPQECEGDYLFSDVQVVATPAFMDTFGDEAMLLAFASQYKILEEHEEADYLQSFTYNGVKYWCISDFHKGDKVSDYKDTPYLYITFCYQVIIKCLRADYITALVKLILRRVLSNG